MAPISIQKRVGARLRAIRVSKGLTQESLEEKDISSRYYSRIERGVVNPTIGTLDSICKKMGVQIEEVFRFSSPKQRMSEDELAVITHMNRALKSGKEEDIRKIRVFFERIL